VTAWVRCVRGWGPAAAADLMADVSQGALGRHRRGWLLHTKCGRGAGRWRTTPSSSLISPRAASRSRENVSIGWFRRGSGTSDARSRSLWSTSISNGITKDSTTGWSRGRPWPTRPAACDDARA